VGALYVFLGVPSCTAAVLFVAGVFVAFVSGGGSFDPSGMDFWTAVAFFIGPLMVVVLALRAWARVRRGEPSFLSPTLTRFVPALIGVGVADALVLGGIARSKYVSQLEREADSFCFTWPNRRDLSREECEEAARGCLQGRPIDESPRSHARRAALRSCMDARVQSDARP
jgi:hypothetical protein